MEDTMIKTLKTAFTAGFVALAMSIGSAQADDLMKPFTLAFTSTGDMKEKIAVVKGALQAKGFEVVGEYEPYDNAHIIIVTSDELKKEAKNNEMGGFAAGQRVAVTKVGDQIQVTYANPMYVSNAYRMKTDLSNVEAKIQSAIGKVEDFGAKGLSQSKLRKYHYTFGMEYFNNVYDLEDYDSYQEAVKAVEKHLASNKHGIAKVYRIDIPGKEETVFGVSMKGVTPDDKYYDDKFQMSVVDFAPVRSTAYLPYEVMVEGNKVIAMHMRFRMAVHFPDLKMMGAASFMTLMPSPGAIETVLSNTVNGK
jgi:uncharacterized protein (DUF302 family)